ncbi:S8 family serine peptidase [Sulfitobacter dubius]|uniref:S8 family serine peptidase n=1 Tax=Sulfitobacter dubius TaxID=218673 RepID=UPI00267CF83E|tara:strand:+ start:90 stop:1586 length:1497 start_codon:yes stop_codon:yes gene_type:complete
MMRVLATQVLIVITWLFVVGVISVVSTGLATTVALADDDDGGDDGDDDSGDDDSDDDDDRSPSARSSDARPGGTGAVNNPRDFLRNLFGGQTAQERRVQRPSAPQPTPRPSPPPIPRPAFAPDEIVTRGLTDEQTAQLEAQGFVVLERADLAVLGTTVRRFQVPNGVSLQEARDTIRALPNGETADFNHFYRTGQDDPANVAGPGGAPACDGLHCPARELIGWPTGLPATGCGIPVTLGIVDTGLNIDHEVLAGAEIDLTRIAPEDYSPSAAVHGTAVAAILVGDPQSRVPGLLPGLSLVAVDAFYKNAGDERADAFTLIRAVDHLAENGVQVINLSLAGPPNTVLEDTLLQLTNERRIPVIAAVGNDGPRADAAYPAAYNNVMAVTAVDRSGIVYRRAIRGPHVELAAQGVEVWTAASVEGARWKTGTSFAAPYVTAAAALLLQQDPTLTPEEIRARLATSARDLGAEGFDDTYGNGLLDLGGVCPGQAMVMPVSLD